MVHYVLCLLRSEAEINKLTIHGGKSEVMVLNRNSFCGPLKPVTLGDKILSYVNSSVCLGVVIDSK